MARFPAPWGPGAPVQVLRVPAWDSHVVLFLAPLHGQLGHWERGRIVSCPGGQLCAAKHAHQKLFWYGYAPIYYLDPRTRKFDPWVLEVTSNMEERLRGRDLVGEVWVLTRDTGKGTSGEVWGEYLETRPKDQIPKPFSIEEPVKRMTGARVFYPHSPNPTPPAVCPEREEVPLPDLQKFAPPVEPVLPPEEIRKRIQSGIRELAKPGRNGGQK